MTHQAPWQQPPSQNQTPTRIAARGLLKTYGTTHALAGVDLDVAPGEALAVMGTSGSGKSTLLLTLAGIERPDAGQVDYNGSGGRSMDIAALNEGERSKLRRAEFGFVFQEGLLIPELTAVENVALPLMVAGSPRLSAETQAAGWLAQLGLAGMETRRLNELSGGQAQRVAIARAQVGGARVVFADEPTGALDSRTSSEVMDVLLTSTVGRGATLIVVTHDAQVAARCDRTVTMQDGRLVG
ncbi:MAG: ABC transporter ATP-binding protein [Galactobacter sp.]